MLSRTGPHQGSGDVRQGPVRGSRRRPNRVAAKRGGGDTCRMVDEVPLPGGWVNEVVLKEGTVRRRLGPHSPFVHRLLRHFEERGWDRAPRLLGIDAEGREQLSYRSEERRGGEEG